MIEIREYEKSDETAVKLIFSQGINGFYKTCVIKHYFWLEFHLLKLYSYLLAVDLKIILYIYYIIRTCQFKIKYLKGEY